EHHPFFDLVIVEHDDLSWTLSHPELAVYSPHRFPADRHYHSYESGFAYQLGQLFYGGLNTLSGADMDPGTYAAGGDVIRVTVGPTAGTSASIVLRWDNQLERGFLEDLRFERAGGDFSGRRIRFSDWTLDPELQVWRADAATEYNHDGSIRS